MTLAQLRTFLAVADAGSVHAAAKQLYVTQSAVSASLTALQRSLGTRLIQRDGRGLRLTDAGVVYAGYIRRVLGLLDEASAAAAAEDDPERGVLRMAAVTTAGEQILPRLLTSFRNRHPQIGIQLEVGNRERVRALLERREVDLLLGGRTTVRRDVTVLGVRPHELIIVAPGDGYTLADRSDLVGWADRQTWLLREKGSGTRETTERYLAGLELPSAPHSLTVGSNAAIREAVIAGLGVTLISRDAVLRELADGTLVEVPLPETPLPRDWHLVAHPGTLPATATALVAHVLMTGEFRRPQQDKPDTEQRARELPDRVGVAPQLRDPITS
ncbi:MAG: LysR family transcriptional regulator [Actinophytocola sp.]|nr:LysR family transcriptional regulator [Actinophytocola sp.]